VSGSSGGVLTYLVACSLRAVIRAYPEERAILREMTCTTCHISLRSKVVVVKTISLRSWSLHSDEVEFCYYNVPDLSAVPAIHLLAAATG